MPEPLGPDSLTWKYFGDLRTGMLGVWIGAIQNMYPQLGAGVEEHSILLRSRCSGSPARSTRSWVWSTTATARPRLARRSGVPHTIKGVDTGPPLSRPGPRHLYWAHATFFMLIIKVAEHFLRRTDQPRSANCSTSTCSGTRCTG